MTGRTRAAGALVAMVLLAGCGRDVPVLEVEALPSPDSGTPSPSDEPSPTPTVSDTPSTEPSPTEETPRPATDTDRARFVSEYQPDGATSLQHVATDLEGDGSEELLFAYVRAGTSHLDVAWWSGTAYEVGFEDTGGSATGVERLRASDINADGRVELVASETGDDGAASVSLWQDVGVAQVVRLAADGGCFDGSHTYGTRGVTFEDRDADGADEIYASCADGSTARYRWDAGAYRLAPVLGG